MKLTLTHGPVLLLDVLLDALLLLLDAAGSLDLRGAAAALLFEVHFFPHFRLCANGKDFFSELQLTSS